MHDIIRIINTEDLPKGADAADLTMDDVVGRYNESLLKKFVRPKDIDKYLEGNKLPHSNSYYKSMDSIGLLPNSGVVVISGRPGHGKSSLMRNMALRKALNGERVVYITYEFCQEEEALNFASTLGDRQRVLDMLGENLLISHELQNIEEIQALANNSYFKGATFFIDYIQKIPSTSFRGDSIGSEAQIRYICNILNEIAIKNNILLVTGSQLTQSRDGSPIQDVVKGARAVEEVASVLLRVWRHNINEGSMLHDMLFKVGNADFTIDVLKNRRGNTSGRIGLYIKEGIILLDRAEIENEDFIL
jgi:predicted ATP-dependent serine protease